MILEVMRSAVDVMARPGGRGAVSVAVMAVIAMLTPPTAASAAEVKPCKVSNINVQRAVDWSRVRFDLPIRYLKQKALSVCRLV